MKTFLQRTLALVILIVGVRASVALHIPEPATVIYGRVFQVSGNREFLLTEGDLVWKIRNLSQAGREYTLRAKLEPIGDGRFSYRLTVPHQVLAYDLSVADKAVPLTATGSSLQHGEITLNGRPVALVAPAVDTFTAQQATRAATYRVDLQLTDNAIDSDGDGLPDWWEDANGFDKWDPSDGRINPGGGTDNLSIAASARTFAEWRATLFPNSTGDLEAFGREDPDQDGVSNFLEYAFMLNPLAKDADTVGALPYAYVADGHAGVAFRKRTVATDLVYQVDVSDNLFDWKDGAAEVEEVTPPSSAPNQSAFRSRSELSTTAAHYFRLRVSRK
jgi:hypothetical protein